MSDFEKIKRNLLKSGELFEDPDFPAIQSSVFYHQTPPFQFVWKRPKEIIPDPIFLPDSPPNNCFDIVPGKYGDCWFTSCIGCLSITKGLFYRVVPADQGFDEDCEYCGLFRFRIWWFGEWQEVLVDDRLPTVNDKLVFVQSGRGDQFWASLLEKAYAKLHGSYEALKYGCSLDGLADLTGGITESINLRTNPTACAPLLQKLLKMTSVVTALVSPNSNNSNNSNNNVNGTSNGNSHNGTNGHHNLINTNGTTNGLNITHSYNHNNHMPARSQRDRLANGLMIGINYRVIAIERIMTNEGENVQLVRLRNPLGHSSEYKGLWAMNSLEWDQVSNDEKERVKYTISIEGEFWMTYQEFLKTFTHLEVIHLDADTSKDEPSLRGRKPWAMKFWRGVWRKGVTAGGCRNHLDTFHINPQIHLSVSDNEDMLICLNQHSVLEPKVIGFSLYLLPTSASTDQKMDKSYFKRNKTLISSSYINSKQVALRVPMEPGQYLLLPTTYEPGQEGPFSIRVYSTYPVKIRLMDCNPCVLKSAIMKAPPSFDAKFSQHEALFLQLADEHKTVNAFELQELLEAGLPNDYIKCCATVEVCRQIVSTLDKNGCGRLKHSDYKSIMWSLRFWLNTFKNHTKGTSGILRAEKLREALIDVGFQVNSEILSLLVLKYMRKDGTIRFGDWCQIILHLAAAFSQFEKRDTNNAGFIKLSLSEWIKISLQS